MNNEYELYYQLGNLEEKEVWHSELWEKIKDNPHLVEFIPAENWNPLSIDFRKSFEEGYASMAEMYLGGIYNFLKLPYIIDDANSPAERMTWIENEVRELGKNALKRQKILPLNNFMIDIANPQTYVGDNPSGFNEKFRELGYTSMILRANELRQMNTSLELTKELKERAYGLLEFLSK